MKKCLSLVIAFFLIVSAMVIPAVADEGTMTYRLAFEDDLDSNIAALYPWWDPGTSLGKNGKSGIVDFANQKLTLGQNSSVSLISSEESQEAANFTNGILQFDLTWGDDTESNAFVVDFGTIDGTATCDIQIRTNINYIRHSGSLKDSTNGVTGAKPNNFQVGKTYRIFVVLNKTTNTEFRVYSAEIFGEDEPKEFTLNAKGSTSALNNYNGGGYLRFRTSKNMPFENTLDNIKIYVPDAKGDLNEEKIIPGYHKTETMSEAEMREYMGLPSLDEVAKTQILNGEYYNLVAEDDFSSSEKKAFWDPDKKLAGSATNGTITISDGKMSIAKSSRQAVVPAAGYEAAGNFSRGIIEFDGTWTGNMNPLTLAFYQGPTAISSVIIYQNYLQTTQFGAGRNMTMGAEGVTAPDFKVGTKYNFKYYIEKDPAYKSCLIRLYVAEYDGDKLGEYTLAGWGRLAEELYDYAGGGYFRISLGAESGTFDIDNFKMYVPADSNKTADSIHIEDIIPDFEKIEAKIEADRAAYADEDGIKMLERIGMIVGEGEGVTEEYLQTKPTRVQAAVLTLRLRGLEDEAKAFVSSDNFSDIGNVSWAKNILAYIKAHPELGMIGVGDNKFEPEETITQQAYAKILLEALGYKYNEDFLWDEVLTFAKEKGMKFHETDNFNIREVAKLTKSALYTPMKDQGAKILFADITNDRFGITDEEYINAPELTEEFLAMKEEAKHKDYGMMVNDDGGDALYSVGTAGLGAVYTPETVPKDKVTPEAFYAWRLDSMLDPDAPQDLKGVAQVNTIVYCTNSDGTLSHYLKDQPDGLPDLSDYTKTKCYTDILIEKYDKDNLDLVIDWCREHDFPIIWSNRMNDNHDTAREEEELSKWKKNNLEHLISRKADRGTLGFGNKSYANLDYCQIEAREAVYTLIKNVVQNYDIDGLQLDFFRHPCFFKEVVMGEKVYPESIEKMNDLMRAIRKMVDAEGMKRGKAIPIMIKVPDSLSYCYNIGLDIQTWIDEGLIDIASTGGYWNLETTWKENVEYYQTKHNIPFYASLSRDTIGTCRDYDVWKKEAALAWESGAKGIETFNVLQGNEDVLRVIGSLETTGPSDGYERQMFNFTTGRYWPGQWLREGVPFRWTDSYPENWSEMTHGEKIYNGGQN